MFPLLHFCVCSLLVALAHRSIYSVFLFPFMCAQTVTAPSTTSALDTSPVRGMAHGLVPPGHRQTPRGGSSEHSDLGHVRRRLRAGWLLGVAGRSLGRADGSASGVISDLERRKIAPVR